MMIEHQTIIFPWFVSLMFFPMSFSNKNLKHPEAIPRRTFEAPSTTCSSTLRSVAVGRPSYCPAPLGHLGDPEAVREMIDKLEQLEFIPAIPLSIYCILYIYIYMCVYV